MSPRRDLALLDALRRKAGKRRRLGLDALWDGLLSAFPGETGGASARRTLAELLRELEQEGALTLPRSAEAWDAGAQPPLPRFVLLAPSPEQARQEEERAAAAAALAAAQTMAWAPELDFARTVRRPEQLAVLRRVQDFLAAGGRERPLVPERERSLELLGDEKQLEKLRRTALFGPGRLSLELLRCFTVPPPLVWRGEPGPAGRSGLVLENHHTYHSFWRWNRQCQAHAAIVYGAGKAFLPALAGLHEVQQETGATEFHYFGDLDREGLSIGQEATRLAAELGLVLVPAARWYALLLARGRTLVMAPGMAPREPGPVSGTAQLPEVTWLPAALRDEAAALLRSGRRLPQELVGWEVLRGMG